MVLADKQIQHFQEEVWEYFRAHGRDMPWRDDPSPYHVLVSELMLQQTQVSRVIPKYQGFVRRFPTIGSLAEAALADVLSEWSGLGYNRRAKFLHAAAGVIAREYSGHMPTTIGGLTELPGVGKNTAGAILAYAFNQPVVFIETNIRTVFFHHFFADDSDIADQQVLPLVAQTLDREHPRHWYWALMDYGTHLKQTLGNNISRSKHYTRQSKFEGSRRQLRGWILRTLLDGPSTIERLNQMLPDERLTSVVDDLVREGFMVNQDGELRLTPLSKLR